VISSNFKLLISWLDLQITAFLSHLGAVCIEAVETVVIKIPQICPKNDAPCSLCRNWIIRYFTEG
jgi:hypothetical protein